MASLKISRIELFYVKIPLQDKAPGFFSKKEYFNPSWIPGFRQTEVRFYVLKLVTDQGHEGHAAIYAMGPERKALGESLGTYLLGLNPLDIDLVNQRIQECSYLGIRNGWIDAAFWDLIGKIKQEPIWKLFGGHGGHVTPYMSTGSTHNHDQAKNREVALQAMDMGFKGIKLRVKSHEIAPMVDFVGAAHDIIGGDMDIMVDANQGWPVDLLDETPKWDVDFAIKFAKSLEQFDVKWLEEPLNRGNFEGLAELRKNTTTPISGGELNSSWRDFKAMLDLGSLDIYQPDAVVAGGTYAGGMSVAYWLIREIQERNKTAKTAKDKVKYCPHTWTTGLGFAVALQLVGILPPEERSLFEYPLEGVWKPDYWAKFIKGGFPIDQNGQIKIPDAPGLGVEIDWGVIRRFGKRVYVGTNTNVALNTLFDRGMREAMYLKKKKEEQLERMSNVQFSVPEAPF